jgi:hypothetical protein
MRGRRYVVVAPLQAQKTIDPDSDRPARASCDRAHHTASTSTASCGRAISTIDSTGLADSSVSRILLVRTTRCRRLVSRAGRPFRYAAASMLAGPGAVSPGSGFRKLPALAVALRWMAGLLEGEAAVIQAVQFSLGGHSRC